MTFPHFNFVGNVIAGTTHVGVLPQISLGVNVVAGFVSLFSNTASAGNTYYIIAIGY